MKTFLFVLLVCLFQVAVFGEDKIYPSEAASGASNFLSKIHEQIADKIRSEIQTDISVQDLQALLNFLDAQSNSVVHSHVEERLDLAAKQLEAARAQAAAILNDPGNKTALSMEPDEWLHEIALQKSQESILLANVGDLRRVIDELVRWDEALDPVMPSSQISDKLKVRLNQLLNEWEQQPSSSNPDQKQLVNNTGSENNMQKKTELVRTAAVQQDSDSEPSAVAANGNSTSNDIFQPVYDASPATADVLKLKRAKVPETVIFTFINNSHRTFGLNHEQIANLRADGISTPLIRAMMRRDWALQSENGIQPNYSN